jgi:hypothetical protein
MEGNMAKIQLFLPADAAKAWGISLPRVYELIHAMPPRVRYEIVEVGGMRFFNILDRDRPAPYGGMIPKSPRGSRRTGETIVNEAITNEASESPSESPEVLPPEAEGT